MIRVGVVGAAGKMGRLVCVAVDGDPGLELVAAVNPSLAGQPLGPLVRLRRGDMRMSGSPDALLDAEVEVAVDFTTPDAVMGNVRYCVDHGINAVVGTTGIGPDRLQEIGRWLQEAKEVGVVVAPNFSIGAVLAQHLAEQAARFFPAAEIVELHHEQKADAPSGTAAATARRIASARQEAWKGPTAGEEFRGGEIEGIRIHSVRLPGLVAHQEVIFGAQGQTLTIRHDSPDRSSFIPGVLMAIRAVDDRPGLTVGLDPLLGL